ncbi:hypothetical protein RJ639_028468 [Escallonia herrerae]|uniref:Uncharacterized protein n=1 Tax=Escallonia herrerae TaxID=1293975 RepID=A0AA88X7B1_9ASTE|nr:hypothetical protein RJ639_028468 [Escallonia herrerae]
MNMQMGLVDGMINMVDKRMNNLEREVQKISGIESGVEELKEGLAMIMERLLKGKNEHQQTTKENPNPESFLSGLKGEVRGMVQMFGPTTLSEAYGKARMQESQLHTLGINSKQSNPLIRKPQPPNWSLPHFQKRTAPQTLSQGSSSTTTSFNTKGGSYKVTKRLTDAERQSKKEKGICYTCDEPFTPTHRCKNKRLFLMVAEEKGRSDEEEENTYEDAVQHWNENEITLHLSINAMEGQPYLNTIRLKGILNHYPISILMDSGLTHNFIDHKVAAKAQCQTIDVPDTLVTIANGTKISNSALCRGLKWTMQGHDFCSDMKVLPLGCYDMVLGVEWMVENNPVSFDYQKRKVTVVKEGKMVTLKGSPDHTDPALQSISCHAIQSSWNELKINDIEEIYCPGHPTYITPRARCQESEAANPA